MLRGVPQGFDLEESLIAEVARFIEDDQRPIERFEVEHEVVVDVCQPSRATHAKLPGDAPQQLLPRFDLRAIHVDGIAVRFDILPGGVGLSDVGQVAEHGREAVLLAHFELRRDVFEDGRFGRLPCRRIGQADAQATGDADPLFVGQHPNRFAPLDAAVLRAAYAKRGGKAGVRAVEIGPTRRQRSPDFLFVFVREAHIFACF